MNTSKRIASVLALSLAAMAPAHAAAPVKNIVLVHGFFADGSGWRGVAAILARDGFDVTVVQQPENSLADDVKATTRAVDAVEGRSILVRHSHGGMVITQAGVDPELERFMAKRAGSRTVEIAGSHVALIAHPDRVARAIEQAALEAGDR